MQEFKKIPEFIYILSGIFVLSSLMAGKYFEEFIVGYAVLLLLFKFFYNQNEPPIILLGLAFQWLSITIGQHYLIFFDAKEIDLLWRPAYSLRTINETYWHSIYGLLAFSLGLKLALANIGEKLNNKSWIQNYNTSSIIILYVGFTLVFQPLAAMLRFALPGLFQAFTTLNYFKWSLFFMMIYISYTKKEYKKIVMGIIGLETIFGFSGYFAEFQDFLILFPIVYLSFNKINNKKQMATIALIAILLINIGALWSYVKIDYRNYLSGGERSQAVVVSKQDALKKLWELTSQVNKETYSMGFEALVKRIYFLEYFSATVNHIPYIRPYMDGANWSKSLQHIFMPRLFFPNKQSIDDSQQTYLLTGIDVAGANEGTSISTGYMAESYADFGPNGMHLAIFLLGLAIGLIYRGLLSNSYNNLWGFALIFPMFFLININGKSLIKIFGNSAYFFIIFYLIKRFAIPQLDQLIRKKT